MRALEMSELLATVEEEEREAEDAEAQAARDRVEEEEALAAVHASQVRELQGRLIIIIIINMLMPAYQ